MGMLRTLALPRALAAVFFVAGLATSVAQASPTTTCLPKSLNADQASALESSLIAALQTATGFKKPVALQSSSVPQKTGSVPVDTVIAQAVLNGIAQYGPELAGSVTSAVIATAEEQGVPPEAIGRGLAKAAATEAAVNPKAAEAIAATISREAKKAEIVAFQTQVTAYGYANLAAIAGSPVSLQVACAAPPVVTVETKPTETPYTDRTFQWFPGGAGGGGERSGCLNPSCTKM